MTNPATGVRRQVSLDFLRAIAVLLTCFCHMTPDAPSWVSESTRRTIKGFEEGAHVGVDLFFVLSGFLVGGLLIREAKRTGHVRIGRFFARRGMKIYPAFYVLLLIAAPMEIALGYGLDWRELLHEIFFLQSYLPGIWPYTWSLAVEEHFYIVVGLAVAWCARASRIEWLAWGCVLLLPTVLVARCITRLVFDGQTANPTHLRMDGLAFGVLLAYAHAYKPQIFDKLTGRGAPLFVVLAILATLPVCFWTFGNAYIDTANHTVTYLAGGVIVIVAHSREALLSRSRVLRFLAYVGSHSYSIYLWHFPAKRAFSAARKMGILVLPWSLELLGFTFVACAVGIGMSLLIERPALAIRERWFPDNPRNKPVAPTTDAAEHGAPTATTPS